MDTVSPQSPWACLHHREASALREKLTKALKGGGNGCAGGFLRIVLIMNSFRWWRGVSGTAPRGHHAPTQRAPRTYPERILHLPRGHLAPTQRASCTYPEGVLHLPRGHHAPAQSASCTCPEGIAHLPRGRRAPTPGGVGTAPGRRWRRLRLWLEVTPGGVAVGQSGAVAAPGDGGSREK